MTKMLLGQGKMAMNLCGSEFEEIKCKSFDWGPGQEQPKPVNSDRFNVGQTGGILSLIQKTSFA